MKQTCVVIGVGPGNGEALVRRFSAEGFSVAMLSRRGDYLNDLARAIPDSTAFPCDVTDTDAVNDTFAEIERVLGPASVVIYNVGGGAFKTVEDATIDEFEANWRVNAGGLVAVAKAALPQLRRHAGASLLITSAGAATRGRATTAPFAAAKAAQRSVAQSLARQLGPERIHVALVIIDAAVDAPRRRAMLPDKPDEYFVKPAAVADTMWALHCQDPSAWTFELDIRPFGERW